MPYVCVSLLIWGFISSILSDAGELFTRAERDIKQIRLPYLLYVCRFMWANVLVLAHNFAIYFVVIGWFGAWPGAVVLFAAPAFVLLVLNGASAGLILGMTSARFRDVPRITASVVQVLFLITPIFWMPAMLGARSWLVDLNPFFHLIEIMRAPLLGRLPASPTVWVVLAMTALNLLVAAGLFSRYRSRIAYWV
jgi:ABC-2 type transport system permease protein/lipopolysaccharide transport system permease protein